MKWLVVGAAVLAGCVASIQPQEHTIRPSKVPLGTFDSYALQPLAVEEMEGDSGDQAAVVEIESRLRGCLRRELQALREDWVERASASDPVSGQPMLVIEPVILALKKVNRTERRLVGAFAGSSAVLLQLRFIDSAAGEIVAAPVFYARGDAWHGSFAPFAATDEAMLRRVVDDACTYTRQNM